jgi:hypothetical protein
VSPPPLEAARDDAPEVDRARRAGHASSRRSASGQRCCEQRTGPMRAWFKRRSQLRGGWGRRPKGDAPRSAAGALGARWLSPARPQPPRRRGDTTRAGLRPGGFLLASHIPSHSSRHRPQPWVADPAVCPDHLRPWHTGALLQLTAAGVRRGSPDQGSRFRWPCRGDLEEHFRFRKMRILGKAGCIWPPRV